MIVKRTYRRGKLIQKRLVVIVVFNNLNMLEGRRIGVGRESMAMSTKKLWSTAPLHLGGLQEELTQMEGLALGKKGSSPLLPDWTMAF